MGLTNAGRDFIASAIVNDGPPTFFTNANAHIGVGNDNTAYNASQTDLLGTDFRQGMESSYPQRSDNVLTFRALFDTGDANFAWEEWGVFNADTGGTMLNRVAESLGTKTSAQSWQMTVEITVGIGS